jgi:predicted dehydrogenase
VSLRSIAGEDRQGDPVINLAVVGYGYWGPNIVRNAMERPEVGVWGLCELDSERVAKFSSRYPGIRTTASFDEVLADPTVDAVSIATPPSTHYPLAAKALRAGKHVLVEKPLATSVADAEDLIELADRNDLVLMPGHTFLYSPAVNKVRQLVASDALGEIYFVTSARMNLGIYQRGGVVNDLAPHDLSILLYWLNEPIVEVAVSARSVIERDVPTTAFLTLTFLSGTTANVQISWLAPRKVREMIIVGSRQMVQYDDAAPDGAVRVYDRGMELSDPENFGEHQLTYRSGDMIAPRLDAAEPLGLELADFAHAITTGSSPRSNAQLGLQVVEVLEAAEASLRRNGQPVAVRHVLEGAAA